MKPKFLSILFTLSLMAGAFSIPVLGEENLAIDTSWVDSETLRIEVTDNQTGESSTKLVDLQDYIASIPVSEQTESAVPNRPGAFTPNGTGTVTDNVSTGVDPETGESKEFFTISTPDENTYYLIVDRQRDKENVYFLNAVTEDDLMSLAKKEIGVSAVPVQETPQPSVTSPPIETPPPPKDNGGNSMLIFILLAVVIGGGAGYYFKIYKPNHQTCEPDDEMDFEDSDDLEQADEDMDEPESDDYPDYDDESDYYPSVEEMSKDDDIE